MMTFHDFHKYSHSFHPLGNQTNKIIPQIPRKSQTQLDSQALSSLPESSTDESTPEERISTPDREYNLPRDHLLSKDPKVPSSLSREREYNYAAGNTGKNIAHDRRPQNLQTQPTLSDTSSAGSPPAIGRRSNNNSYDLTSDLLEFSISGSHANHHRLPPDVTQFNANTRRGADRVTRYVNLSNTEAGDTSTAGRWKVSAKIQQLLNTLKRPKRRPLPEFYEDNDIELEIAANPKDPNAPKPEGSTMTPVQGEQLVIPSGLPRTLEAALQRYGSSSFKVS
jgi:hypothetical protein